MDIQWEEPPETAVLRSRGGGGKYIDLAIGLREHPGRWALLPSDTERSEKGAAATAQNLRRGKIKGFDKGLYESAHQGHKVWVRYMPPPEGSEAPQGDAGGASDDASGTPKPPAADVRAWATKQGLDVPKAGRLPDDLLTKYSEALARGEVGLPLRVLRSAEGGDDE